LLKKYHLLIGGGTMKGEDKIFLLCAFYSVSGGEEAQKRFKEDDRLTERLVDFVSTYTKTEINDQLLKFKEMEKHE
jgi:hypothetical protein